MSEWNPRIVRIERIDPHPNADKLEIAYVDGNYPVVVSKGDYPVGSLAAYVPIDSVVPDNDIFAFLIPPKQEQYYDEDGKQKTRITGKKFEVGSVPLSFRIIKAKKIRGVYSQGLLIKGLQWESPKAVSFSFTQGDPGILHSEGSSIVEFFNLTKWEEPEDDESKFRTGNGSSVKAPFFKLPYYDIEGFRKFAKFLKPDDIVILEEKIHGCNAAYTHDGENLVIRSRTVYKSHDNDNLWALMATKYNLHEKLKRFPMLAFFGEIYGQVKNFPYDSQNGESNLRFFDIYDVKEKRYLDWGKRNFILSELMLPIVPWLTLSKWEKYTIDQWMEFAEGKSFLNSNHVREGFVLRTIDNRFEPELDSRMIVKCVGEGYNLAKL